MVDFATLVMNKEILFEKTLEREKEQYFCFSIYDEKKNNFSTGIKFVQTPC
jgi:hypothetical protein